MQQFISLVKIYRPWEGSFPFTRTSVEGFSEAETLKQPHERESEVERLDGKRWEAALDHSYGPQSAAWPGGASRPLGFPRHEFPPRFPQPSQPATTGGGGKCQDKSHNQTGPTEPFPSDDSFRRTTLCRVRILLFFFFLSFKGGFPNAATYVLNSRLFFRLSPREGFRCARDFSGRFREGSVSTLSRGRLL